MVGLNCSRGPHTILPLLREARKVCNVSDDDDGDDDDDDDNVVGLNCGRGPHTILPLLREARKVCKVTDDEDDCDGYGNRWDTDNDDDRTDVWSWTSLHAAAA